MAEISESYPMTPMQQGMLFHTLSYPGSGVDVQQIVCTVKEPFNASAFKGAWERIIERHAVLRTSFEWEGVETPMQKVVEQVATPLEFHDLQELNSSARETKIKEYIKGDRVKGIDLSKAPMMRVAVFHLNLSEFTFLWTFHHAILDGRSDRKLLEEFFQLYDASLEGQEIELDLLKPYREYAEWIEKQDFSYSEFYWRDTLKGLNSPTPIPFSDQNEITPDAAETGILETCISSDKKEILQSFAAEKGVTLNTLVQGAWGLLLHHYCRVNNIVFGVTRACRYSSIEGAADMVGLFINTLPLCVRIDREQKLADYLKGIREQNLILRKYENTPLPSIHQWSELPPNSNLFETIIVFEKGSLNHKLRMLGGRWLNRHFVRHRKTGYPISLIVFDDQDLIVRIEYERHLFDAKDIERIGVHIQNLLVEFSSYSEQSVVRVPYLSEDELDTLLIKWNDTHKDYPTTLTLVDLFESQVEKTPDAAALVYEGSTLTYRQLNQRSNQLAHCLKRASVGSDVPVGIFMDRSIEMVMGIYGIIKAGGAYVPLDPEYPAERLSFMIEDTRIPVLLTQSHLLDRLPGHPAQVICLDTEWEQLEPESTRNPVGGYRPENLAYIIYTSGSTGKPKGVMNEHRGIVNRLLWMQEAYQLDESDRVLQKTPFSFDVSVWEFFWPLQVGARLVIAKPGGHQDNDYLIGLITEKEITTLHFVPSMLQLFLEGDGVENCHSIKRVICSGEALRYEHQKRFFERFKTAELHNLYGPTEAAVDVTFWPCQRNDDSHVVPIGFPVANTRMYILDPELQPVPIGCVGELFIGGVQVARGYLKRPELTAKNFIVDPFNKDPLARLYKTGDLGRYRPDGSIEYLGRIDFQVKICGLRVELGEIETHIDEFEGVGQCVVVLSQEGFADQILVAYYTVLSGHSVDVVKMRSYLQSCLPDYMVPQHFMPLETMPLLHNGKIDRKALPRSKFERNTNVVYVAPRNRAEKIVADMWKKILNLDRVGIDDSFFDLGGHSFLLIRMYGILKSHFDKELKISDFFQYSTIRKLIEYLTMEKEDDLSSRIWKAAAGQKAFLKQQKR